MKKKVMLILSCLFISIGFITAQTKSISGTVVDEVGEPVIGASVVVKGTTIGVATDVDGRFTIGMPQGQTMLEFSLIGMRTVEARATNGMRVTMATDEAMLEEVVVTGYGTGRKLGSLVGSVTQISSKDIKDRPSPNVFDGLQGKVAGLQVYTNSGEPTQLASIKLHGVGSLDGSNAPLYILDNAPVPQGTILNLSQNDFESVTILKDASATSIYGARASNGVIVVTTKRGNRNMKPVVTLKGQYGSSSLATRKYFDRFMDTQELLNFWLESGIRQAYVVEDLNNRYGNVNYDWTKYVYKDSAPMYEGSASVQGGSDRVNYFLSLNYLDQDGLAYRSNFKRYNLRSNIDITLNDKFRLGVNLNLGYNTRATNPDGGNYLNGGISYLLPPFYTPYDENGNEYYDQLIPGVNFYSQKYRHDKFPYSDNRVVLNASAYVEYRPISGMTIRSQHSLDGMDRRLSQRRLASYVGAPNNGYTSESAGRETTYTMTNTAEYRWGLNDNRHRFSVLLGHEYIDYNNDSFQTTLYGYTDDRLTLLGVGTSQPDYNASLAEYAFLSFFGRADYSLDEKYFFDATLRNDQSSRFGRNNRSGWFGAVGGMWKLKNESFLQDVSWLSNLDLKFTWGTQGNAEIGNYDSYATVGSSNYNGYGWIMSAAGNPDLGWEKQQKYTLSVHPSFFSDRLRFEFEGYKKLTSDMLVNVPYPYTSGFASIRSNVAEMSNTGIDITASYDVLQHRDYSLNIWANYNYNKNEVTKLFPGAIDDKYWIRSGYSTAWVIGQPRSLYVPLFAGVDPEDGLPMWYLPGDDATATTRDPNRTTKTYSESLSQNTAAALDPPHIGGFGLIAGYKDFSLQVDFGWAIGKYIINNDRYFSENPNQFTAQNTTRNLQDYWKQPGDNAKYPDPRKTSQYGPMTNFDDRLVEDASFLRLKNISLGYNIPKSILNKTNFISSARIYVVGRNLFTTTKYLGKDPELDSNLTYGSNPSTKQYSIGVELTF